MSGGCVSEYPRFRFQALQSTVRNLTALTKRLQNGNFTDNDRGSKYTPELILKLKESVNELAAEMHKAGGDLPSTLMQPSSSTGELEERFRTSAAQLKANVQDCTRTFDLCKVAMNNQTPPSSLSEHEMSHFIRETEWKRQQESKQLLLLQKAEEELQQLKEEMSSKETESQKKLLKAEEEKQGLKDLLAVVEADFTKARQQLEKVEAEWKSEVSAKEELERQLKETEATLKTSKEQLQLEERRRQDIEKTFDESQKNFKTILDDLEKKLQVAKEAMSVNEVSLINKMDAMRKLEVKVEELTLKEMDHQNYVAQVEKDEAQSIAAAHAFAKSQIESLQDEAKVSIFLSKTDACMHDPFTELPIFVSALQIKARRNHRGIE